MTTLYVKEGRRYVPWGNAEPWGSDTMRVGTFRLTYCVGGGERRYRYDVRPDTAGFVAAAELCQHAMEQAMQAAALSKPEPVPVPYTAKQLELIDKFTADMAATGALCPQYWVTDTAREIAQAGVDAVRRFNL
ncbi:MAG: hypothetical protein ACRC1H_19280 [Caldilineaceae bacterium]